MNNIETNIINLDFDYFKNKDNFNTILENKLENFKKNLKKKILICATELIQNNFIHNDFKNISLEIKKRETSYILIVEQIVENEKSLKILQKIVEINKKNIDELKEIYKNNLQNSCLDNVGNGLIICKIKSKNNIETTKKENCLIIKLLFNDEKD